MSGVPEKSARQAMLSGTVWTVSMRWGTRLLGLISTVIMARLILPAEYAVVAMAMLVVGLIESFFDLGAETAILRKAEVDHDYVNSAWSLRVVEGAVIGLFLVLVSHSAGEYFGDGRVVPVLWMLAFCVVLSSSANIGLVLARKELNFFLDFKIQLIVKILQVIVTVVAAWYLRDYRALVIGVFIGYVSGWALSYLMHDYRPAWRTSAFVEIWHVTRWLMLSNVARFVVRKSDELIAGRIGTSHQFGLYNVGADLGQMPTGEVGPAILKAFLPVLSSIQHDAGRIHSGVLKVLAIVNAVTLPAGFGVAAMALPITLLVLGENWIEAAAIVGLFGIAGAIQVAANPLSTLLILRGFTRCQSGIVWIEFVTFAIACMVFVPELHLQGLIYARIARALMSVILFAFECHRKCGLPMFSSLGMIWRPLFASLVMYFVVGMALDVSDNLYLDFMIGIAAGVVTYAVLMLFSWYITGRPQGLEHEVVSFITSRQQRVD